MDTSYFPLRILLNGDGEQINIDSNDSFFDLLLPGSILDSSDLNYDYKDDVIKLFYDIFAKKYYILQGQIFDKEIEFKVLFESPDIFEFYKYFYSNIGTDISYKLAFDSPVELFQKVVEHESEKSGFPLIISFHKNEGEDSDNCAVNYYVFIELRDDDFYLHVVQHPGFEKSNSDHQAFMSTEEIFSSVGVDDKNHLTFKKKGWSDFFREMNDEKSLVKSSLSQKYYFANDDIKKINEIFDDLSESIGVIEEIGFVKEVDRDSRLLNEKLKGMK